MKNRPQYAIDSVDHALYLAQLLQQEGPLGVTQAAERLSVARSTAHRLLAPGRPCNTFDTVGADTPARSAIRATLISERNRPSLDPSRPAAVTTGWNPNRSCARSCPGASATRPRCARTTWTNSSASAATPGYSTVARAVYRNLPSLVAARARYPEVTAPVHLIYGDKDWSRPSDQQANRRLLPNAEFTLVPRAGHFIALERPDVPADLLNTVA